MKWGIRTPRRKLHEGKLFDLVADPREQHDLAGQRPDLVAELTREAAEIVSRRPPLPVRPHTPDDQTRKDLRALGYLR